MSIADRFSSILFISTFPPLKCGIASFTNDLIKSIGDDIRNDTEIVICALDKVNTLKDYERPVTMVMDGHSIDSCIETARAVNQDPAIGLVCIEHEFGLYGGEMGSHLLRFLSFLEKPFIIRFHTVLPSPVPKRLQLVRTIGLLAEKVIVMTANSAKLLIEDYQLEPEKISIIPHGTHQNSSVHPEELKKKYSLEDKLVLTTFGLLSPNKGVENGILAMKKIRLKYPQSVYIVLGLTHPNLLLQEGERYRQSLQALIDEHDLQENVRLVNEYVPTEMLMEYLTLTDVYLFTSKDPNQAVSGTFLYAMSAGCAIISNDFVLAKEMLDEHTGIIIEPGQELALAQSALFLLQNKDIRTEMGRQAFLKTRNTPWNIVAEKHLELFDQLFRKPTQEVASSFYWMN
ncbi:glycosyltransferase [Pseudobacter ginsenosidimutans]|uniref:Glycosyltransferase involved in cell wall biosynthesis n=1 Tax=Pseudobacter ginsenosidimutans TaxID=661488 RepID=A0A4Q7N466_9BACT|nr:glycosyltransferase [Pseudobacter ginsenosidimutans]QEC44331.1 glycosyltransferase [Pseudobacter ginsenosidimutans]RZS75793.1 glycosyltransferase involved in cell wall biosynthesis [Pseudobacter ginsenosidimutans]